MTLLDEAIVFATNAHSGQYRKVAKIPYIVHPMEVASIIATMTNDQTVMAAGILHDTVEDCGISMEEIKEKFGERVLELVACETENKREERPAAETWQERKEESLLWLKSSKDIDVKIIWLADKLSNMRSFYRLYQKNGNDMWTYFHQKDVKVQKWYYDSVAEYTAELSNTNAYKEYMDLIKKIFGGND